MTLLTQYTLSEYIGALPVEIIIGKIKLLFRCSYNPHESIIPYHLQEIGLGLEIYTSNCETIFLMGDFKLSETLMNSFCNLYIPKCVVSGLTFCEDP